MEPQVNRKRCTRAETSNARMKLHAFSVNNIHATMVEDPNLVAGAYMSASLLWGRYSRKTFGYLAPAVLVFLLTLNYLFRTRAENADLSRSPLAVAIAKSKMENPHEQNYPSETTSNGVSGNGNKRTGDERLPSQPRSKRSRYISIAWCVHSSALLSLHVMNTDATRQQ